MNTELTHVDAINFAIEFFAARGKTLQPNMRSGLISDWAKHVARLQQSIDQSPIVESNESIEDSGFEGFSHGSGSGSG